MAATLWTRSWRVRPCDGVDGAEDAHLQIDRRLLHEGSPWLADRGGRWSIEAKAGAANDDILRCWPIAADFALAGGSECADNSATTDVGVAGGACRAAPPTRDGVRVCRRVATGLHEEGPHRMLEGGDGTVGVGEGGLEMGEDLRRGSVCGFGRQLGRRAARRQCRADLALAVVEPFPDALPGPVAAAGSRQRGWRRDAAGDGVLEEPPQAAGGQAEPSDLVGDPDAEGPPAAGPCMAVAAKDPPGAEGFALGIAVVESVQKPWRIRVPTALQWGHGVCLSRSAMAFHSSSLR